MTHTGPLAHVDFDAASNLLTISAGGYNDTITARSIARNFDALSHFPDRRAAFELRALCGRLAGFFEVVEKLRADGGAVDATDAERFARRHVSLSRRYWAMEGRCMSWFVVGPANFPTARNAKRQRATDRAGTELRAHEIAARKSVRRAAWPHGAPDGAIRASNPDAPDLLRAKIAKRRDWHAAMKKANTAIRACKGDDTEKARAVCDAIGWPMSLAAQLVQPDYAGRRGFADYQLSSELAEIKRLESRLTAIETKRERGDSRSDHDTRCGSVTLETDAAADRVRLIFDGKPPADVIAQLKARGFRWAPSVGAWQRQLTPAARHAAECVLRFASTAFA